MGFNSGFKGLITNYSQQDATFLDLFIFTDALYVSGGATVEEKAQSAIYSTVAASSSIG